MRRDRILLVTYDFPPGLSGVRRMVKFAKFLPEFGFDPIVLSATPDDRMPLDFHTLAQVEEQGYPVYRAGSLDPYHAWAKLAGMPGRARAVWAKMLKALNAPDSPAERLGRAALTPAIAQPDAASSEKRGVCRRVAGATGRALNRWLFVPDDRIGWVPMANAQADRILRSRPVRFVLTSSYPNSTHLVGSHLKKRFRVKWIADFRDGWTQNPYFGRYPTPLHAALNRGLERRVAANADAVITVSEPIAQHLSSIGGGDRVQVIPNGFDPDDFAGLDRITFNRFTIAYTGTLFMQRSPEHFFAAVRGLLDTYPGVAENFQVIFMTRFRPEHEAAIADLGIGNVIQNWGLRPYREALRLQISADALLVMEGEAKNSEIMLTQKIFEYLATGKPILAITPPGALGDVIRRTGAGVVVPPDDIYQIKERLYDLFNGQVRCDRDAHAIARFHRREQARQLAGILESLRG
jgi:glycosyltransferase involved in cell wall biosynthesis